MRQRISNTPRWIVGAALLALLVTVCTVAMGGLVRKVFPKGGETITAVFESTAGLQKGTDVRVRGVDSGQVEEVEVDEGGRTATVRLKVYDAAPPIHADARAAIAYRTILGGNLVVNLDPGSTGDLDRPIPVSRTSNQVEVDDLTSAFDAGARSGLRTLVDELPTALADPHAPGATLEALGDGSPAIAAGTSALRGRRNGELSRLVVNAARVVRAVDEPTQPVRSVLADAATTLAATARRRADIQETLRRAPATLADTATTVRRLDTTLALADPLLDALRSPAGDLAPTARALRPVLVRADRVLAGATPLLRALRPAAHDLRRMADDAVPLLDGLDPSVRRLQQEILPKLDEVDPDSERATYEMVGPTFAGLTGASGQFDGEAHVFRFPVLGGGNSFNTAPCRQYLTDPSDDRIADCQALFDLLNGNGASPGRGGRR